MNFLQETLKAIEASEHKPEDIVFIGSPESGHCCTFQEFEALADRVYDNSYGSQQVAADLIVAFSDGSRLVRAEYDGSEWWDFISNFSTPLVKLPIKTLFVKPAQIGWESLASCNEAD